MTNQILRYTGKGHQKGVNGEQSDFSCKAGFCNVSHVFQKILSNKQKLNKQTEKRRSWNEINLSVENTEYMAFLDVAFKKIIYMSIELISDLLYDNETTSLTMKGEKGLPNVLPSFI